MTISSALKLLVPDSRSFCPATVKTHDGRLMPSLALLFIKIAFNMNGSCQASSVSTQAESPKRALQAREKVSGSVKGKWT